MSESTSYIKSLTSHMRERERGREGEGERERERRFLEREDFLLSMFALLETCSIVQTEIILNQNN
jgi:hypothetical protein